MRLMAPPKRGIWQRAAWPTFRFDAATVAASLADAYTACGLLAGKAAAIGLAPGSEIELQALSDEVVATAAIEGERLPMEAVRSSVMRRLGRSTAARVDRHVEGAVQVIDDATRAHADPLTHDRLCRWQSALFPGGTSGIRRIAVGRYREHQDPMQIIAGPPGREVVHYEAPASREVPAEMGRFLDWFARTAPAAGEEAIDGLARAAIAHAWFESIHPFEDGNGRVGRAIADLAIAQQMRPRLRLWSLSRQLQIGRSTYYDRLNQLQRGDGDATAWVAWFAEQVACAARSAEQVIDAALLKQRFWDAHAAHVNERQRKVLQRLLDAGDGGFEGGLNAAKYIQITGASKPTATRDLADLVAGGQVWSTGAGRAVRYYVAVPGWGHGVTRD